MNINNKFGVGDRAVFGPTQERVTILKVCSTVNKYGTYITYGIVLNSGFSTVTEDALEATEPTSKVKVGDRVVLNDAARMHGHPYGTVTQVGPDGRGRLVIAVNLSTSCCLFIYSDSKLSFYDEVSPHYFQD